MAAWQIQISTGARTPIYRQIVEQVRLAAATGVLAPGSPLPTVRSLAEQLLINANTVAKAYAELVREGVLESRQSVGYFVAPKRQIYSKAERFRRLRQAVDDCIREAIFLDFTAEEIHSAVDKSLAMHEWKAAAAETFK